MLFASNISKAYSERTLFSGLSLSMSAGDRIALIGAKGALPQQNVTFRK